MAADQHDLVGKFAAANLADDVGRFDVGFEARLHPQPHANTPPAVGQPLHALGVLGGDRRGRNPRRILRVGHVAGVRRAQADRANRANQRGDRPVTCRRARAAGAVLIGLPVARVRPRCRARSCPWPPHRAA